MTSGHHWIEGRFLDGQLTLLLSELADPGPGYAVNPITGRIWRNGEYVGDALTLRYDRDALGWWVAYRTWPGSPLIGPDHPAPVARRSRQASLDLRDRILAYITERESVNPSDLQRHFHLSKSGLARHTSALTEANRIHRTGVANTSRLHPGPQPNMPPGPELDDLDRAILQIIAAYKDGITVGAIHKRAGRDCDYDLIRSRVRRLRTANLVRHRGETRARVYLPVADTDVRPAGAMPLPPVEDAEPHEGATSDVEAVGAPPPAPTAPPPPTEPPPTEPSPIEPPPIEPPPIEPPATEPSPIEPPPIEPPPIEPPATPSSRAGRSPTIRRTIPPPPRPRPASTVGGDEIIFDNPHRPEGQALRERIIDLCREEPRTLRELSRILVINVNEIAIQINRIQRELLTSSTDPTELLVRDGDTYTIRRHPKENES